MFYYLMHIPYYLNANLPSLFLICSDKYLKKNSPVAFDFHRIEQPPVFIILILVKI